MSEQAGTIIVTGAAGGIGRETVRRLLERGETLLCTDINAERLTALRDEFATSAGVISTVVSDLSTPEACRAVVAAASSPVTGLVHLAGVFEPDVLGSGDMTAYDRAISANLTNAYTMVDAIVAASNITQGGAMVFASSMAFTRGSIRYVSYAAAKGGLVGLTRALSRGLAPRFRVNAVAPGLIDTAMPQKVIAEKGVDQLTADIPLKRLGTAGEVADLIVFLMGSASTYITGQTINIDGGVAFS